MYTFLLMDYARAVSLKMSTSLWTSSTIQNKSKLINMVMRIELTRETLMRLFSNFLRNSTIHFRIC